jgi:very-short-patch-repair endonuclease
MNEGEYKRLKRGMSADVRALNAGSAGGPATRRGGKAKRPAVGTRKKRDQSPLDLKFWQMWRGAHGPPLTPEHRFHPVRKWSADYAHLASRTLIELEGGIAYKSRHTSPEGFVEDCRKYNAAAALGWAVFRLPTGFTVDDVELIVAYIRERSAP